MKENYLFILFFIFSLIYCLVKYKNKKPHLILGILIAIIFNLDPSVVPMSKKWACTLILSGLIGLYDFSYRQKVKGLWRYFLASIIFGFYNLIFKL